MIMYLDFRRGRTKRGKPVEKRIFSREGRYDMMRSDGALAGVCIPSFRLRFGACRKTELVRGRGVLERQYSGLLLSEKSREVRKLSHAGGECKGSKW